MTLQIKIFELISHSIFLIIFQKNDFTNKISQFIYFNHIPKNNYF